MIAELFLPERYGSYFFMTRRNVACMITPLSVRIAVIRVSRSQRFIEQLLEHPVDQDPAMPLHERISAAVQVVMREVPSSARIMVVVPSSQVIFKIITVPLMSLEKIKLIIPFEVESSLPFSWSDAAIDCVIIRENKEEKKAQVLVMATTKATIEEQKSYFSAAGKSPELITTSAIVLCGLSQDLPQFFDPERPVVTLYVDQQETIIIVSYHGTIVSLRVLSQGLRDCFAEEGIDKNRVQGFARTIVATGTSFLEQAGYSDLVPKLIVCGVGSAHKEICEAVAQEWNVLCELLTINKILHTGTIVSHAALTNAFLLPIAAALPHSFTEEVNLDRDVAEETSKRTIVRQLVGAGALLIMLLGSLLVVRGVMLSRMRATYAEASQEAITKLEKSLDEQNAPFKKLPKGTTLDRANTLAEDEVRRREEIWFSVASPNRFAALRVLLELSKRVQREVLGLELRRLDFVFVPRENQRSLVLEGKVKDVEALKSLEESLSASKMWTLKDTLQTPEFVAYLILSKTLEEEV
jgi:hypothetical protein